MTEENKNALLATIKKYSRIDYDDDDEIIELIADVVLEEMKELINDFDENSLSRRQELLILIQTKHLYDNREAYGDRKAMKTAASSLLLKEMYK